MNNPEGENKSKQQENTQNESSKLPELPEIPDMSAIRKSLSQGIHKVVHSTNQALASLQHTTDAVRKPIHNGLQTLEHTSTEVATMARITYERRHEFAPYWVLGSFVSVGGFFSFWRGKIPGMLLGVMAGGLTYVALYEDALAEAPTFDWPFRNLTRSVGGGSSDDGKKK